MRRYAVVMAIIILLMPMATACKDVIVMDGGTAGDYNLFMKVRDPSRPGTQVLCMIEKGYEYTYHHPWKGYNIPYRFEHKVIGVVTAGDAPPNIFKAGMLMSDADIAYGDADSPTFYVNPTKFSWDDFDWLRYAAQTASTTEEAVNLLKEVQEMHAPDVGENLFVVGRNDAYVIEADAFHFVSEKADGIVVMSNYPKQLWHTRLLRRVAIASDFDRVFEGSVRKWQTVRIGGMEGVKFTKIDENGVVAKQTPAGNKVKISKGEGAKVGNFYVEVEEIDGKRAQVRVCYEYYAWENKIKDILQQKYGRITVMDLMNLSRMQSEDLNGLRGMCEGEKKATMIFRIPTGDGITMGWFAPDQCASIFVPVHICDTAIAEEYTNGMAAEQALAILTSVGKTDFSSVEHVLIKENEKMEEIALKSDKASDIMTLTDTEMQRQAFLMQKLYLGVSKENRAKVLRMWKDDYYTTICNMASVIKGMDEEEKGMVARIALSMANIRAGVDEIINGSELSQEYSMAKEMVEKGKYDDAIGIIKSIFMKSDNQLFGISHPSEESGNDRYILIASFIIFVTIVAVMLKKPGKKE